MISKSRVSVIGEWHKNLKYLNRRLLKTPPTSPTANEARASIMKFPAIVKGVEDVKSAFDND